MFLLRAFMTLAQDAKLDRWGCFFFHEKTGE